MKLRSSSRTVLFLILLACPVHAQSSLRWLTTGSVDAQFQKLLFGYLESTQHLEVQNQTIKPEDLDTILSTTKPGAPVVVQLMLQDYERSIRNPDFRDLLSRWNLRLLNPRLFSTPLFILSFTGQADKADPLQVSYITAPTYGLQEADLLNVLSEVLSRPKSSIHVYRERDAYTTAKNFYSGSYQVVGIYEDEPSTLLDELNVNLVQELKARQPKLVSTKADEPGSLHDVAPERLAYVFIPEKDGTMTALVQEMNTPFPVFLSNLPKSLEPGFSLALSYAYFLDLPYATRTVTEADRDRIERAYLYNAFVNDPDNRLKGIAFASHLMLMKDRAGTDSRARELFDDKLKLFLKSLNLQKANAKTVMDWLGIKIPELNKRQMFTSDVSQIYQDAISRIEKATGASGEPRTALLEQARQDLIAVILHDDQPKDIKGSRGLWSITNYNPYYQLGRVMFYLQQENQP